jgi:hypothetical protein
MNNITLSDIAAQNLRLLDQMNSSPALPSEQLPQTTSIVILKYLSDHFKTFTTEYEAEARGSKEYENVMSLFRFPFATYLTTTLFKHLTYQLEGCSQLMSKERLSELDLHHLLYTL